MIAPAQALDQTAGLLETSQLYAWEVFLVSQQELSLQAKEGQIETLTRATETGLAVRALVDSGRGLKAGAAFTYDFSPQALAEAVAQAKGLALLSPPEPDLDLAPPPHSLPQIETLDPELASISQEEKARLALELEAVGLAYDPRIVKVRRAGYQERQTQVWLRNSLGLDLFRAGTLCQVEILLLARQGQENQTGYDFAFSPFFRRLDPAACAKTAASLAVGLLGAGRGQSGPFPVVFSNLVAAELLSVLAPAFLAENVQKGKSLLAGRLGQKVFSDKVSILDDGLYKEGLGSRPFDDEGTPQQTTHLVNDGLLQGFLYDRLAAARGKRPPTGNGRRPSLKTPPLTQPTNFYLKPGQGNLESLIADLAEGFLVSEVMGLHTADPISGEFSLGASGFWIKDGRKNRPIQAAAISGNLLDLFGRVARVGADLKFIGQVGSPSFLVDRLDVAG